MVAASVEKRAVWRHVVWVGTGVNAVVVAARSNIERERRILQEGFCVDFNVKVVVGG